MMRVQELSTFFICMLIAVEGYKRLPKCWKDSDCMDNAFCSRLMLCLECFPCDMFFRYPPQNNCARRLGDCGTCISGYYEVSWKMCTRDYRRAVQHESAERTTIHIVSASYSSTGLTYTELSTVRSTSTHMTTSLSTSTEVTTNSRNPKGMMVSPLIYMLVTAANVVQRNNSMAAKQNLHSIPEVPSSATGTVLVIILEATSVSAIFIIICVLHQYCLCKTNRQSKDDQIRDGKTGCTQEENLLPGEKESK